MLGFNGGLLGVRREPSSFAASGLWFLNEQSAAKRAGIWPRVVTDPTAGLSPVLWYDFADETTVITSSGQITQIADKGIANRTLTSSATGPTYATTINNRKVSNWGTSNHSNFLRNSSGTSLTVAELYFVVDSSDTNSFASYSALMTNISSLDIYLNGFSEGFEGPYGLNRAYLNGGTTNRYTNLFPEITSPCIIRSNKADSTTITTVDGFQIGMDRGNGSRGWRGLIAEVICFSSVLSSQDRTDLQEWLAFKWGITLV